jgi:lipopolysaccharide transport protein LptA
MRTLLMIWATVALTLARDAQAAAPAPETPADATAAPAPAVVATNEPAPAAAPAHARPATEIFSDSADFNLKTHRVVYTGHVRVVDPQMKLTCGIMTATGPQSGRITNIVAEQDVVIDAVDNEGKPVHATGERAVYQYHVVHSVTNETVELTGNPRVEKTGYVATADTITWDRVNNTFRLDRPHIVIQPETKPRTNAPATSETPATP